MLRYLALALLIYFIYRYLKYLSSFINNPTRKKDDPNVRVENDPNKKKDFGDGEYIDYEEIK